MKIISKTRDWYGRYERPISSFSLIAGFVFDAVALKRVDMFWENIWILGHIVLAGMCMMFLYRMEMFAGDEADPKKVHFWFVNILQFMFGGLLSVFLVFYFRSSELSVSWPFLAVLALAFWANESLKRQFVRMSFQVSILFLSIFLSTIFIVPILMHQIGPVPFIFAGIISLVVICGFLYILSLLDRRKFEQGRRRTSVSVLVIYIVMNGLYFTSIIPPIPLSLKDSGVYHTIVRNDNSKLEISYEDSTLWEKYTRIYEPFHLVSGGDVYVYSAIFSPTSLDTNIIHKWQYYDEKTGNWKDFSQVKLPVIGGREDGFRTFSRQSVIFPGKWRVDVMTENGQIIGRLRFEAFTQPGLPLLKTRVLD